MGEEVSESALRAAGGAGRYRLLAELGRGGMANVYLAVARGPIGFNKLCVLKALRGSLADEPDAVAMFVDEARLAARLNHANVVQTYEVVEDAGRHLMVMEYLEGQALADIFARGERRAGEVPAGDSSPDESEEKEGHLPLAMHLQILSSVLAGLHYAHELADFDGRPLGIVHRDVSPHNVMVGFDGHVKVLDFGIAKVLAGSTRATRTGVIKGKVRYMAPEQMAGEAVDRRADIFGVGVLLWEALAGVHIWKGMTDNTVIAAVTRGEIPPPRPRPAGPELPERLAAICTKATRPRRRWRRSSTMSCGGSAARSRRERSARSSRSSSPRGASGRRPRSKLRCGASSCRARTSCRFFARTCIERATPGPPPSSRRASTPATFARARSRRG